MDDETVFEWDPVKADANLGKHGVRFVVSTGVFSDRRREDYDVSRDEDEEERRKCVGKVEGRLLTVVYTRRGDAIRIISARRANTVEIRRYGDR